MNFRDFLSEAAEGLKAMVDIDNNIVNGTNADSGTNWTVAKTEDGGFHAKIGKGASDGVEGTFYSAKDAEKFLKDQGAEETNIAYSLGMLK